MLIEIMSVGPHTSSSGRDVEYTLQDLQQTAEKYNRDVAASTSNEKPAVIGHPSSDSPAVGWVKYLNVKEDKLVAEINFVDPTFQKDYADKRYKNVSVSFYDDKTLRHVGFLGGAIPAVKNLRTAEFSETSDTVSPTSEVEELQKKISLLNAQIAVFEKAKRLESYRRQCEKSTENITSESFRNVLVDNFPKIMELAYEYDKNFGDDGASKFGEIEQLIDKISKITLAENFSESKKRISATISGNAFIGKDTEFEGKNVDNARLDLHRRTLEFIRLNPGYTYERALNMLSENGNKKG